MISESTSYAGKCIRCGACMSICPIYQVSQDESDVARGKMALFDCQKDTPDIIYDARFKELISRCLLCGACANSCPNQVPTCGNVQAMRQQLSPSLLENMMMTSLKTLSKQNLPGQVFQKTASIFQKYFGKKIPDQSGMHLRFPISSMSGRKYTPQLQSHAFADQYVYNEKDSAKKILYFTGCGANYFFQETASALTEILQANHIKPIIPKKQMCCGLPFFAAGDMMNALQAARKNIDIIKAIAPDIILTTCASCGAQINQWPDLLRNDPNYYPLVNKIAKYHQDATQFVLNNCCQKDGINTKIQESLWYHHPCHLRFGRTQLPLPTQLFKMFPNVIVTYSDNQCCGNGGKFQISHFGLSMQIFDQRMEIFKAKNIDRVLTGCIGCQMQFYEGMLQQEFSIPVMHPLVWLKDKFR